MFIPGRMLTSLAAAFGLCSCTPSSQYMGVDLRPASAVALDARALATKAQSGDKQAQLELGIAFEEGRLGLRPDAKRATKLYAAAAMDTGGTRTAFIPNNGAVSAMTQYAGPLVPGLKEARAKLALAHLKERKRSSSRLDQCFEKEYKWTLQTEDHSPTMFFAVEESDDMILSLEKKYDTVSKHIDVELDIYRTEEDFWIYFDGHKSLKVDKLDNNDLNMSKSININIEKAIVMFSSEIYIEFGTGNYCLVSPPSKTLLDEWIRVKNVESR